MSHRRSARKRLFVLPRSLGVAVLLAGAWAAAAGPAPEATKPDQARVLHSEPSQVGTIFVVEEDGLRYLRFDDPLGDDQSSVDPAHPDAVPMDYVRLALACLAHADRHERVLMIGLGAGTFTTAIFKALPKARIDAVEISPEVVRVARKWFGLPNDPRYRVHLSEGGHYITHATQRFDVIFLDAYTEISTPEVMKAGGTFTSLKMRLRPGGAVLINLAGEPELERRALAGMGAAFGPPTCYETPDGDNLVVVARADKRRLTKAQVGTRVAALAKAGKWSVDLAAALGTPVACP